MIGIYIFELPENVTPRLTETVVRFFENHFIPFAFVSFRNKLQCRHSAQPAINQTHPVVQSSRGCGIGRFAGVAPVTRFYPSHLPSLAHELATWALNTFRAAVRVAIVFKFGLARRSDREVHDRDEMNFGIKIVAVLQTIGRELRVLRVRKSRAEDNDTDDADGGFRCHVKSAAKPDDASPRSILNHR